MQGFNAMKKLAMNEMAVGGVEPRIKHLVDVFNSLSGIFTTSSCGGHENVEKATQAPLDGFAIDFFVDVEKGGWRSLTLITQAAWIAGGEEITIHTWITPSYHLAFSIRGENNISPDALAGLLDPRE